MDTGKCSGISGTIASFTHGAIIRTCRWACLPAFHPISLGNSTGRHSWEASSSSSTMDKCIFSSLPQNKWKIVISSPTAVNKYKIKEANSLQWQLQKDSLWRFLIFFVVVVYLAMKLFCQASFQQPLYHVLTVLLFQLFLLSTDTFAWAA